MKEFNTPIIQQIQPQCDSLHLKMKDAKERQHKTNQEIADLTGLPLSNVGKFFSGTLSNPGIYNTAALCIALSLSLDNLMGIGNNRTDAATSAQRIAELERQNAELKHSLYIEGAISKRLERGLAERTPVIYALMGICVLLTVALISYITVDVMARDSGLFVAGKVSILGIVEIVAVVVAVVTCIALVAHSFILKNRKEMINNEKPNS